MLKLVNVCSMIAKAEGKKHQATIGDIREIISILLRLCVEDNEVYNCLVTEYSKAEYKAMKEKDERVRKNKKRSRKT